MTIWRLRVRRSNPRKTRSENSSSLLTFEANGSAAGFRSYIVRYLALVNPSIFLFQFDNVKGDRVSCFDNLILPAVLQQLLVFVPGQLERWCAINFTVETGILPSNTL